MKLDDEELQCLLLLALTAFAAGNALKPNLYVVVPRIADMFPIQRNCNDKNK